MGTEGDTAAEAPVVQDGTFAGSRGRQIYWQSWSPAGDQQPKGTVVIVHGLAEHLGRYRFVAQRLAFEGYAAYALDQHGHGHSEGTRARVNIAEAAADLDHLISLIGSSQPRSPTFLLGHGFGGGVALRYAMHRQDRLEGMILSAPLAAIRQNELRLLKTLVGVIAPWMPMTRIEPKWLSRDPRVVSRYITDDLVFHRAIPGGTVREVMLQLQTLADDVSQITLPTLVMYGTADRVCPPSGSVMLTNRLGCEDLTTQAYEDLYHELLNEPEREHVIGNVIDWLDARTSERGRD